MRLIFYNGCGDLETVSELAYRHWPTSVFRRCTWHHCATVAAAQRPFYFACWQSPRTHMRRVLTSRCVTFPGSRVACSAQLQLTVVSRHSSVCRVATLLHFASSANCFYYYFNIFRRIKSRRVINFPLVPSPLIRDNIPSRWCRCDRQVRSTTVSAT